MALAALLASLFLTLPGCSGDEPAAGVRLGFSSYSMPHFQAQLRMVMLAAVKKPASRLQSQVKELQRIGQIEIPRIGIREWMVQGTSKEALHLGAGHLPETPLPGMGGNFALAGDRVLYTAPFLRLNQVGIGDEIILHMPYADLRYRVESKFNVDPTQVSVLDPRGYDSITLSTCDPTWQLYTRLIVSARLVDADPKG